MCSLCNHVFFSCGCSTDTSRKKTWTKRFWETLLLLQWKRLTGELTELDLTSYPDNFWYCLPVQPCPSTDRWCFVCFCIVLNLQERCADIQLLNNVLNIITFTCTEIMCIDKILVLSRV